MEDSEIIELYFARSDRAVTETAAKYGKLLRSAAFGILRSDADSEECENDAYLAAWDKIPPARPDNLGAFLTRITRNIAINKYAYYTADKRNRGLETALGELGEIASGAETPESRYESAELGGYITAYLTGLSRAKRVVFIRRYWYCDSVREIAGKFGFSESKVKSMLMRSRNGLKKYLEGKGIEL